MKKLVTTFITFLLIACCQVTDGSKISKIITSESEALRYLIQSTVIVENSQHSGSGTIIYSEEGYILILTCYHVIRNTIDTIEINSIESPYIETTEVIVEKIDKDNDLALLSAKLTHAPRAIKIAKKDSELYEKLYLMGAPLRNYGTVTQGFLISKNREVNIEKPKVFWVVTGGLFWAGISGGTALNGNGELECVPAAVEGTKDQIVSQIGYCIGLPTIKKFLASYKI